MIVNYVIIFLVLHCIFVYVAVSKTITNNMGLPIESKQLYVPKLTEIAEGTYANALSKIH